jgi:hypothetical protein
MAKPRGTQGRRFSTRQEDKANELRAVAKSFGFDRTNYKNLPETELAWWYQTLSYRRDLLMEMYPIPKEERRPTKEFLARFRKMIEHPAKLGRTKSSHNSTVRHVTISFISHLATQLPDPLAGVPESKFPWEYDFDERMNLTKFEVELSRGKKPTECMVSVDLLAANDVLRDDFDALIRDARSRAGIDMRRKKTHVSITRNEVRKWIDGYLLPYVDLKLIFGIEGWDDISDTDIGTVLYPEKGTEWESIADAMKTPRKHYKAVMNHQFLLFLRTQNLAKSTMVQR